MSEHAAQAPLDYGEDPAEQTLEMTVAGMRIYLRPTDGRVERAVSHLKRAGCEAETAEGSAVIPASDLLKLRGLPKHVRITPIAEAVTLHLLATNPPSDSAPVILSFDTGTTLNLSWPGERFDYNEPFPAGSANALLAAGVPLVAHPDAWATLSRQTSLPLALAHARVKLDGYVELTTPVPHHVINAGIPGLFRIDDSRLGVPMPYAKKVEAVRGVVWSGPLPTADRSSVDVRNVRHRLSTHATEELNELAGAIAGNYGQMIVWESGLGRRVFALAVIASLDSWPCTVVTTPEQMWTWHRHAELAGRTIAVTHQRNDIHLMTYHDLRAGRRVESPASIVFDNLDQVAEEDGAMTGTRRLDGAVDAHRIGLARTLPDDPEDLIRMMACVRPGEFRTDMPALVRYPGDTRNQMRAHVECYVERRDSTNTSPAGFPRSSVADLEPPRALREHLVRMYDHGGDPGGLLTEIVGIMSHGTDSTLSPKIGHAAERIVEAAAAGLSIAVVTAFERTASMLSDLTGAKVTGPGGDGETSAIILTEGQPPGNLRRYNQVLFVEQPASYSTITRAVGKSGDAGCPRLVEVLHLRGTADDRIAVLGATRRESDRIAGEDRPYSESELLRLLGRSGQ